MQGPASPLSAEANELICRTGAGSPMGEVVRRYWVPALLSTELPAPDSPPVQVKLLGEDLVAFRDTSGRVGIVQWWCAHRGTPLWMGRNEENGLRCLYHGWKYDVDGNCVDQMNEPPEAQFKDKINLVSYPTVEMGDIIWAYMGPKDKRPPDPKFEFTQVPSTHRHVVKTRQKSNWMQALEGGIDPSHAPILHGGLTKSTGAEAGRGVNADDPLMKPKVYRMYVEPTDYGQQFWAVGATKDENFVMGHHFVMPWTQIRLHTRNPDLVAGHFYVPIDDNNAMVWDWEYCFSEDPLSEMEVEWLEQHSGYGSGHIDQTTFLPYANQDNQWLLSRDVQKTKRFSGMPSNGDEDRAVQEGAGPIIDRSRENLGQSDMPLIGVRRRLMEAVRVVADEGAPVGTGNSYYGIRALGRAYPRDVDWRAETMKLMHPQDYAGAGS
jgi:phenylpropionate dioxygenase-like ring-hydroxylating dioxygenase large terminal subunit